MIRTRDLAAASQTFGWRSQLTEEAAEEDVAIGPLDPGDRAFLDNEHYHLYLGVGTFSDGHQTLLHVISTV